MREDNAVLHGAGEAASEREWLARLKKVGERTGYLEPLGKRHAALFQDAGPVLVVSFETAVSIRFARPDQLPMGFAVAQERGWSSLTLIARGDTWYRDPAVYAFFDRLVDEAFFDDFDRVVFYGAGMAGYAAAAFSAAAPGATVIAVAPQATLDPRVTGWDRRFLQMRRTSFTDRYGYAPEMLEGAARGFVIFDPLETLDAMHVALFTRPFVTKLRCPGLGPEIEPALSAMGMLTHLLWAAGDGLLDEKVFYRLYRARRRHQPYLRRLVARMEDAGRPVLAALVCRYGATRLGLPRFLSRLEQLQRELAGRGVKLPPRRR